MKRLLAISLLMLVPVMAQKVTIEFWHGMGGVLGEATESLVKDFNAAQDKITVKSQYYGSYDDGINKLLAGFRSGAVPSVIQIYDIGTRILVDSGQVVTLSELAERDKFNLENLVKGPKNYYTIDGKLYSLPFNSSTPLLYFNAKALEDAGVAYKVTWTLAELEQAARKLTIKDASGKTIRYGITAAIDSWYVEQISYNSGQYFCNNENGRAGRATAMTFDNPAAVAFLDTWARMVRDGVMANTGRNGGDSQALFSKGDAAIAFYSTASLTGVTNLVGGKFPIKTAYYPFHKVRNGVSIGGASLWLLKGKPQAETEAAWQFVKFLLQPTTQAKWHLATGYFPVIEGVKERQDVRAAHSKNPNFTMAIQQLASSKPNTYATGCLAGSLPEIRQYVNTAIEETIKGKPAAQALAEAKQKADAALARYNSSVAR